jgi:hypothetical protein
MNILRNFKKIRIPVLLIMFSFLLISLLIHHNYKLERTLPSEGWSRSIPFPETVGMSPSIAYQDGEISHVYNHDDEQVFHYIVDEGLEIKKLSRYPVKIPANAPFWAKENQLLFYRNGEIIFFDGVEERVLIQDVNGMSANQNNIIYWNENELFSLNSKNLSGKSVGQIEHKIDNVILNDQATSFLVVSDRESLNLKLTFFKETDGIYQPIEITTISEAGVEDVTGFSLIGDNHKIGIMYTTYSTAQHKLNYRAYYGEVTLDEKKIEPNFKEMLFYVEGSYERLRKPRYVTMTLKGNVPTVLLSAEGTTIGKRRNENIYAAVQEKDKWITNRRSTNQGVSVNPIFLNTDANLWQNFSNEEYTIMASSKHVEAISKSKVITKEDWENIFSYTVSGIFTGLLILFFSILWIVIPFLFLVIINFINDELLEKKWVELVSYGLFLVTQLLFSQKLFNHSVYTYAPDYITFPGSFIVIPVLIAAIAYLLLKSGTNPEWSIYKRVLYFIGMDVLFIILLIGPYTI